MIECFLDSIFCRTAESQCVFSCHKQGYEDGFEEGRLKGWREGFEIGLQKGHELGAEVSLLNDYH